MIGAGETDMKFLTVVMLAAILGGCAASKQEVAARLGAEYIGQNVDALVLRFGPPISAFKMNSGDSSQVWQLGAGTSIQGDGNGGGTASTYYCKITVIASPKGTINQLNTEDSNASGLIGATGVYGSFCGNVLGMKPARQS